ncbi:MAG TPA: tetratricopeptide repeat protein [Rhodocyclaceae bacterium]|nr:tetratricopeptide repeat protein [Rhodocyclaceae bacterium]
MDHTLEDARQLFLQGIEHFEAGRFEPARTAFAESLALAPGRPSVLANLGITLFHLGRLAEATPLLREAVSANTQHGEAWTALGLSLEAQGQWQAAADALTQALALAPTQVHLWVSKGQCLLRLGRAQEALQAYDQALAANPAFADAWSVRGSLMRELEELEEAARCFEQALACGGDPELNGYYLASVKGSAAPPPPPRRYVEALFDDYAPEFQAHVVEQLRYQGYARLLQPLIDRQRRFHRAIDLGCGTGLCGSLLHPLVDAVDGVDLSRAMLEEARKLGIYRTLSHADLVSFLESPQEKADLVIAADVFIYVGDLHRIFESVRRLLTPDGCFAFTVEAPAEGDDFQLLPSLRYAHSEAYIRRLAEAHGFSVDEISHAPIRYDQEQAVEGMYVYLR